MNSLYHSSLSALDDPNSVVSRDGLPPGKAEVGSFFQDQQGQGPPPPDEEIRGLSEFDLTRFTKLETFPTEPEALGSAELFFNVSTGGLLGQPPRFEPMEIVLYSGNNAEDIADYQAAEFSTFSFILDPGGEFDEPQILELGNTFSVERSSDGTPLFKFLQEAVLSGGESLGVRIQPAGGIPVGTPSESLAWTFDNFRLETVFVVPIPSTLILFGSGLAGGLAAWRLKKAKATNG